MFTTKDDGESVQRFYSEMALHQKMRFQEIGDTRCVIREGVHTLTIDTAKGGDGTIILYRLKNTGQ